MAVFITRPPAFLPPCLTLFPPSPHTPELGILGTSQCSSPFHPAPPNTSCSTPWSIPSLPMRMGLSAGRASPNLGGRPHSHPRISHSQLSCPSQLVFSLLPAGGCHVREGKETMQRKLISMA